MDPSGKVDGSGEMDRVAPDAKFVPVLGVKGTSHIRSLTSYSRSSTAVSVAWQVSRGSRHGFSLPTGYVSGLVYHEDVHSPHTSVSPFIDQRSLFFP